ncbi:Mu-like prophage protein Com [compost metagenome]
MKNLRCGDCAKLRCKAGGSYEIQIKPPLRGAEPHEGREPPLGSPRATPRRLYP